MKNFEAPEVKILTFAVEDVITTSGDFVPPSQGPNQTPYG